MIRLMCPVICSTKNLPVMLHLGLLCQVSSRHVQGSAKICSGSKPEGRDEAFPGPFAAADLTVRINKYNKEIELCKFSVQDYGFGPN